MRPDTRNKRDYGRGYDLDTARRDLAMGVHFGVVSVRLGVREDDLAAMLDLFERGSSERGSTARWLEKAAR